MNPQDPLANLHPLREPGAIGWWPPAPGWWLLAALLLAAILAGALLYAKHRRASAYRRQAAAQLEQLYAEYHNDEDAVTYASGVNALLKRVAITAYPKTDLAGLHGRKWLDFLHAQVSDAQFGEDFVDAIYRGEKTRIDTGKLHSSASDWIRRHRGTA